MIKFFKDMGIVFTTSRFWELLGINYFVFTVGNELLPLINFSRIDECVIFIVSYTQALKEYRGD